MTPLVLSSSYWYITFSEIISSPVYERNRWLAVDPTLVRGFLHPSSLESFKG